MAVEHHPPNHDPPTGTAALEQRRSVDAAGGDPVLTVDGLTCDFGAERAVDDLSLTVRQGELCTLLGPSGCGKTTTLRCIAGLERPDAGSVAIDGETVASTDVHVSPAERDVGLVFQDFALFPHLTAGENVAYGVSDWPAERRERRVEELLDLVGLADQGDSTPDQLSGGQQQRIALARALAPNPHVLLLDEPFSNLDRDLRVQTREEVRRILVEAGVTAVFVTHDQEEALSISDRVAVVNDGSVEQAGHPEAVFQQPTSRFVAEFLGHASFLSGYVHGDEVETAVGTLDRERVDGLARAYDRTTVDVMVRPDDVVATPCPGATGSGATDEGGDEAGDAVDAADGNGSGATLDGTAADGRVTYRRYLGPSVLYRVELENGDTVECMHNHARTIDLEQPVRVDVTADHDLAWFPREEHAD